MTNPRDESPQQRVDYYVDRQVASRRAAGDETSAEDLRRATVRIMEMADAERANTARHPIKSRRPEKPASEVLEAKRQAGPHAMAEASGTTFFYRDEAVEPLIAKPVAKPALAPLKGGDLEQHIALIKRLQLLMATIPGYRLKPGESLYANKVHPRFAQLLDQNTRNAALTDPNSHGLGDYEGLSLEDRGRRYYRMLEVICTASDPVIGRGWWIPK